jgi:hypothetical protein
MTDRDYFAAAALTRGMGVLGYEQIAKSCYEMADAMLRNRERTNHDAVPEARAAEPESSVPPGSVAAPANTPTLTDAEREAIETADAYMSAAGCHNTNVQKTLRGLLEATEIALLRLTEAEHDALEFVVETGRVAMHDEAILRKLLERLNT